MKFDTKNALNTAIKSMSYNSQNRIKSVENIGVEMMLIENKKSKLPYKTRAALIDLANRFNDCKENNIYL